jgi:hypothetical protein
MAPRLGRYHLLYCGEAVPTSVTNKGTKSFASDLVDTHRGMMPGEETEPKTSQRRTLLLRRNDISYRQTTDRRGVAKTH